MYRMDLNRQHEIDHRLFDEYIIDSLHHHDWLVQDLLHCLIQHFVLLIQLLLHQYHLHKLYQYLKELIITR